MKVLVTGAAGFIGSHTVKALLAQGNEVVGIDNLNDYYDRRLKYARLADVGIGHGDFAHGAQSASLPAYRFLCLDITDKQQLQQLFAQEHFDTVIHLAAQAGVQYSISHPDLYVQSNVVGFLHMLECCRLFPPRHLIYASSSSVYGLNDKLPFAERDCTDRPVSLYAATKKSNELLAHTYAHLHGIPVTGIRFFTVYGPWGRPDMAPYIFLEAVLAGRPIQLYNNGRMIRDFTYIDDAVKGLLLIAGRIPSGEVPAHIYNIGNSSPMELLDFITIIERVTGRTAIRQMIDMQPGNVLCTHADTSQFERDFGYKPFTPVEEGIRRFYTWYNTYKRK